MKRGAIYLGVAIGVVLLAWAAVQARYYYALAFGVSDVTVLGGGWEITERTSPLQHGAAFRTLTRSGASSPVAVGVREVVFIPPGCVEYSISRIEGLELWAACDRRRPALLVPASRDDWRLEAVGLCRYERGGREPVEVITTAQALRKASEQPVESLGRN
jgi:hypothetical protein